MARQRVARGPDFIGIGAQKAGTTWLSEMLRAHAHVHFPGGKEVHFWDAAYPNGVDWYASLFGAAEPRVQGDITPAYAILPLDRIREARELNPHVPIVYVLRNPMQRAWSSALMALGRAELSLAEASDQWFLDHFRSGGSRRRGDYEACLRNWRSVFSPEQILVLRFEDVVERPRELLARTCAHIGADPHAFDAVSEADLSEKVFAGDGTPIRPSLVAPLHALYDGQIQSLGDYLGWDMQAWLADPAT